MSFVIDNITTLDSGFVCRHPHGSILVFFELCVTILSKIHQKYLENHDSRGVVVAPVFTVIRMISVVNNMTNLDTGCSPGTLEAP